MKSSFVFLPVFIAIAMAACTPKAASKMTETKAAEPTQSPYLGTWNYSVPGTPMGDVSGKLILKMENGQVKGHIEADGSVSVIEDLKLEEKSMTGNIFYSGSLVKLEGMFEGDKYNGSLVVDGAGTFKIMATRVPK